MKQNRPKFSEMWKHFSTVHVPVVEVGKLIGGKIQQNIELELTQPGKGFANACTIRLCYCLHRAGLVIGQGAWATVSGADKKTYIYRVNDYRKFMEASFGKPDKTMLRPTPQEIAKMKGILIFTRQWGNASGHATLWNGITCADACYFPDSSKAELWLLK